MNTGNKLKKTLLTTLTVAAHCLTLRILWLVATSASLAFSAHAETTNCTAITSVPFTISTPGIYCFTGNVSTSITTGNAITITASDVVLDLNGFALQLILGGGQQTEANGIYALNQNNITVRNGTIGGFFRGLFLEIGTGRTLSGRGHIVEYLRVTHSKARGIEIRGGRGTLIRHNQILSTGGSTVLIPDACAIETSGVGHRILYNDVVDVSGLQGVGINNGVQIPIAPDSVIEGNRVSGVNFGIFTSNDVTIVNNYVSATTIGLFSPVSQNVYLKDNVIRALNPYSGNLVDAGGNYPPVP